MALTPVQLETKKLDPPPDNTPSSEGETAQPVSPEELEKQVIAAIQTCYDPEIPVNIYELGLIYGVDIQPEGNVHIRMTLTSPACPAAGTLPPEVESKVKDVPGVKDCRVEVVWDPPWNQSMMSEVAAVELGLF